MKKDLATRPLYDGEVDLLGRFFGRSPFSILENIFSDDFVVDITESSDAINLLAELPGVKKEDISVDLHDGILTLKAEKKEVLEDKGEAFLRKESRFGSMQRSFTVGDVDAENITATFNDGVLKVSLKKKDVEFKKISIA